MGFYSKQLSTSNDTITIMSGYRGAFDNMDRGHGSGARSSTEDFDASSRYESDNEFSKSRTTFEKSQANSNEGKWERLRKMNRHEPRGEDKEFFRRAERLQDTKLFCDVLELPKELTKRVIDVVDEFDFDSKKYGKAYEKLILVIINLLHDKTLGEGDSYKDRVIYDDTYKELMEVTGLDSTERQRIRNNIRKNSEHF